MTQENKHYAVVTDVGKQLLRQAYEHNRAINLTKMSLGDSSGAYVAPDVTFEALVNELGQEALHEGAVHEHLIHAIVYVNQSKFAGKHIREFGLRDEDGNLIVYAAYPETLVSDEATSQFIQLEIECIVELENTEMVTLTITPIYPHATESEAGIARISTAAQIVEGTDDSAFLTIKKLLQRAASLTKAGVVQLSSSVSSESETQAATSKAVKTVYDRLVDPIDTMGLSAQMWLGNIIPSTHTELDGKSFDKVLNPKLAELFPAGLLPDTRGMVLKHAPNGRQVLSFEAEAVKSHGHTASFNGNPLPPHSHHQAFADDYKGVGNIVRGAQYAGAFNLNAASAGTPSGTVVVNSSGSPKNLVDNIAVKFIIRKA